MSRRFSPPLALALLLPAAAAAQGVPEAVTGTVVDAAGEPVAGAAVGVVLPGGPAFVTTTAADGAFTVPTESESWGRPRLPHLIARGPDGDLAVGSGFPQPDDFPATLMLGPPHRLTVTARRPDGAPAAGVPVYALSSLDPVTVAETGPDGVAALDLPADAPLGGVVAVRPGVGFGYALAERPGPGEDAPPKPESLDVPLAETFTHRVRCVVEDPETGETAPAAGAEVSVWYVTQPGRRDDVNLGGLAFARTAAGPDGTATFDWLPKNFERSIPLWVGGASRDPAGPAGAGYGRVRSYVGRNPQVAPEEAEEIAPGEHTVRLDRLATLAGRVTNPDGSPTAGVTVRAEGTYPDADMTENERETAVTDADGRYETTVRGNAAFLVVPLPGSRSMYEETDPPSKLAAAAAGLDEPIVVPPGGRRDGVDFTLSEGELLTGTVIRGEGPDADPAAGVTVLLNMKGEFPEALKHPDNQFVHSLDLPRWAKTGDDGRYAFRVGPGTYNLTADYTIRSENDFTVAGGEGEVVKNFTLPLPPEPVEITGTVVDEFGLTLAGVTVAAGEGRWEMRQWPERTATARSGADGAFSLSYLRSEHANDRGVYLTATGVDDVRGPLYGYLDLRPRSGSEDPPPTAGVTLTARRLAALTGRALGPGGAPLAGVSLQASPDGVNEHGGSGDPLTLRCVTGPGGRFLFRDAACGVTQEVYFKPESTYHRVAAATLDGKPVTDAGEARGLVGRSEITVPGLETRLRTAFAEPDDLAAELASLKSDAALLNRNALLLVADPASEAGRDLFAALYDDAKLGRAADAGFLTRCLAAERPTRTATLAESLGTPVDPAAAALIAVTPDGAVAGTYAHAVGERGAVRAFLEGTN